MEKTVIAAFIVIVLATCPPTLASQVESGFASIQTEFFTLRFPAQSEKEAKQVQSFCERAVAEMLKEFADHDPKPLLRTADCTIYLYDKPNDKASESVALVETGMRGDRYFATFHLLLASAHSPTARTNMGEPKDMDYLFRTMVHEYSTVILERLNRNKKQGWRFFSAPNWFVQGYENYLGLMHSSEHSRNVTFAKHIQCLLAAPDRITFDFGIMVQDPYIDGTILLAFMHDVYGKQKVQSLLVSEQPTFGKAMRVVLVEDLTTFADKFAKWMDEKRTSNKEPEATR